MRLCTTPVAASPVTRVAASSTATAGVASGRQRGVAKTTQRSYQRGGDLRVTQAAMTKHQQRRRPPGQPTERPPHLTPALRLLDDSLRVRDGRLGGVQRMRRFPLGSPPLAPNHVERRMDGGRVQPSGGPLGVGGETPMELEEDLLGHILGRRPIGKYPVGDGDDLWVFL